MEKHLLPKDIMFTLEDIRNIAIQIETNGENTYRKVAENATDKDVKAIFTWMADEEHRHAEWFKNFKTSTPLTPEQEELANMGKNLLQDMVKDQTFSLDPDQLANAANLYDMLSQSVVFEQDTVLFYEFIGGLLSDEETGRQLENIIAEEKKHAAQLQDLADSFQTQSAH